MKFTRAERLKLQADYAEKYPGIVRDFTRRILELDIGAYECFKACFDSVLSRDTFKELHRLARLGKALEANVCQ